MTRPGPPHATSTDLLVLHALRCIGFAGLGRVAAATGLPEPDVESELIDLAVAGLVTHAAGDFGGWGLTEAGRAVDAERIAGELETAGTRTVVAAAYDGFLVLNPELLDLCTAWQMRSVDGVVTTERPQRPRLRRPGPRPAHRPRPACRGRLRRPVGGDAPLPALSRPARRRPRPREVRRAGLRDRQHRVLPHRVVPAARRPARHPRHPAMRWIHPLAAETEESADVLGGKAHGLVVLLRLGLPVPAGFVIGTEACRAFLATGGCPTASMSSWRRPSPSSKAATRAAAGGVGPVRRARVDARHDDHHPQPARGPAGGAGGRASRVLVMGHAAGPDLPRAARHPARPRHGRDRAGDGVREPRPPQRHRGRVQPRPQHRRARARSARSCSAARATTSSPADPPPGPCTNWPTGSRRCGPACWTP